MGRGTSCLPACPSCTRRNTTACAPPGRPGCVAASRPRKANFWRGLSPRCASCSCGCSWTSVTGQDEEFVPVRRPVINHLRPAGRVRPGSVVEVPQDAGRSQPPQNLLLHQPGTGNPSRLARRLHLPTPTVTHPLNALRLAGLVNLTFRGQEKSYRAWLEAVEATYASPGHFLRNPPADPGHQLDFEPPAFSPAPSGFFLETRAYLTRAPAGRSGRPA